MADHFTLPTLISITIALTIWMCVVEVDSQLETSDIEDYSDWRRIQEEQFQQDISRDRRVPLPGFVKRALTLLAQGKTYGAARNRPPHTFVSAVARGISRPKGQPLRWG